ncbi:Clavaminate synthase-like protein [Cucurbitaria berberidis CBS 394.84]|uniref:Clavaminate synthase-like protein n=1 Tax=Cucurbitaria berberidis CBS 394.84 TaxID=1168544 RepID=A0A9P4GE22_9PLEO|nr:Clavaminate synthase-like protein [Cucurbitaria berberidis CBS 394.84]KAF1843611.1 Clavaminate synthase-like protein [Cucurbitaria berberidis CBS 394.84]
MERSIPIVDFGLFLNGGKEEREQIARELDDAFRSVGFVYLRNHGVSRKMVGRCFEWSKAFFDLPLKTKMLAPHPPGGSHHRGYSAPGVEKVSQHKYGVEEIKKDREIPDYKESFESGNVNDSAQPNIWLPEDELPGFKEFMETYFTECAELIHRILDALSIALNVPEPGLSSTHSHSLFQLRLLHYPAIDAEQLSQNKRSRINAHSDFGTLTLLFQDNVGGLEIEDPHQPGAFCPAEPIQDTVLVNIGDLMARWSNDRWRSTVHRVGLPGENRQVDGDRGLGRAVVPDRYSIPVFATANMDTVIDALPSCWDEEGNLKKYEPVTAWGYVQMRMAALYDS